MTLLLYALTIFLFTSLRSSTAPDKLVADEELIAAIQAKEIDALEKMLPGCDNINQIFSSGYALIHYAAEGGSVAMVHALCNAGANPTIQAHFPDKIIPLIESSLIQWDGFTPLHFAASLGNLPLVQYLVEGQKVNINATDAFNNSPLVYAIEGAHVAIIDYLVKRNANLFATINWLGDVVKISNTTSKWHEHSDDARKITCILSSKMTSLSDTARQNMRDDARRQFKAVRPASPDSC